MKNLRRYVTNQMLTFGFRSSLAGFYYFREAVIASALDPSLPITVLYNRLGERTGVAGSRVERCLRTLIQKVDDIPSSVDKLTGFHIPADFYTNKDLVSLFAMTVSMNYNRLIYPDDSCGPSPLAPKPDCAVLADKVRKDEDCLDDVMAGHKCFAPKLTCASNAITPREDNAAVSSCAREAQLADTMSTDSENERTPKHNANANPEDDDNSSFSQSLGFRNWALCK